MKFMQIVSATTLATVLTFGAAAQAADYPSKQIELMVPSSAGGGTDTVARAFAEAAKKYLPKPIGVVNKPGGSGAIGLTELALARPDGYKMGMTIVEMSILPSLGMVSFTTDDFRPIARLNADPAAVTVKADAPWNTIEEFVAYAKANPRAIRVGNSGSGSIWHLAAGALEEKTGAQFNHVPFDGASPAVTALLGGHIEAVTVSPGEVINHVAGGKLKTLAIMADQRVKGFETVPTLKERKIDLSIGTWRGLVVPKNTPQNVVDVLKVAAKKIAEEPAFMDTLARLNLGYGYLDDAAFKVVINQDRETFKALIAKLGLK